MSTLTRRRVALAAALILALPLATARARQVAGVDVPDHVRLGEAGPELRLNGAGIRTKYFLKIYVGALYATAPVQDASAVLADAGAQRILIHMIRTLDSKTLAESLEEGLRANHTPDELRPLEDRIKKIVTLLTARPKVETGSVVDLDYVPGTGTQVIADGAPLGTIEGADFHTALTKIWFGTQPVDADLEAAMLGK